MTDGEIASLYDSKMSTDYHNAFSERMYLIVSSDSQGQFLNTDVLLCMHVLPCISAVYTTARFSGGSRIFKRGIPVSTIMVNQA